MITLEETRRGAERDAPIIVKDGALYDADLDRFFRDLPSNGARSRHTLRAYGYDIMVWTRFLEEARGKSIWSADRDDLAAYHRARRRSAAAHRVSASSWNRAIAALDKLYAWALDEGVVSASPFRRRVVWRRGRGGRPAQVVAANQAYERAAKGASVPLVAMDEFKRFNDVGLRGLASDGHARRDARDRNGQRNVLFAELIFATGLRLEEISSLLALELPAPSRARAVRFVLPPRLTKGDRGRTIVIPRRILIELHRYAGLERAAACAKFRAHGGFHDMAAPICCRPPRGGARLLESSDGLISLDELTPAERLRLVLVDAQGAPIEAAGLWLSETGLPLQPNSWEAIFARASRRCADTGLSIKVTPHQLRHAFAVHMLAMLIRKTIADVGEGERDPTSAAYRRLLGDPLHAVQRLLGHASIETTYIYLECLAGLQDTVDQAIEELLGPALEAAA